MDRLTRSAAALATLCVLATLTAAAAAATIHDAPAGSGSIQHSGRTAGFEFTVGPADILVTSFGVRASGFGSASTLQVGIWLPDGTEIEKHRVANDDPLLNGWRYASLDTPLLLQAGTNYILGARTFNALYRVEPVTDDYLHPAVTLVQGRFGSCTFCGGSNPPAVFPDSVSATHYYVHPNLQFTAVPLPPGLLLFLPAVAALLKVKRRQD